jgi:hypothetical protein
MFSVLLDRKAEQAGIDGEERGIEPLIANHTLDGGAGLTLIEQDRMRVDKFARYEIVTQTLADLQHRGLKKIGFVNNDLF